MSSTAGRTDGRDDTSGYDEPVPSDPAPDGPVRDSSPDRQPWLHDLDITVLGIVTCVAAGSGDLGDSPADGLYVDDRRVVRDLRLRYDGLRPTQLTSRAVGHRAASYLVARELGAAGPDPTVTVLRERTLGSLGMVERLTVSSSALEPVATTLTVDLAGDGLDLGSVKAGARSPGLLPTTVDGSGATWEDRLHRTCVVAERAQVSALPDGGARLAWALTLGPGETREVQLDVQVTRLAPTAFDADAGGGLVDWSGFKVEAEDRRLDLTVATSVQDLAGLLQSDPAEPGDPYAGAGSPWYLTLFGRDSIWTARFALPLGTELARGTLQALARRQGRRTDARTAEEPGKIVHEVRRADAEDSAGGHSLPPVYYGTVDATPLWILLLHEAWRWGLSDAVVTSLRPALDAALGWVRRSVDASADGLLRYDDPTGEGLSNQGWKDSHDAMRRRDGSIASSPIALLEVQGYAVQAARAGAALREELFKESDDGLREWADALETRVREQFWVEDGAGPYLAMALDRDGSPVDGVGSNMGHVLGTGLLDADECDRVAERLTSPDLLGPFGIGTLGRSNPAYNPIGYHTGSVWVHDATICARGLASSGHDAAAGATLRALLEGAMHFDFRLPELYGADPAIGTPAPYPASCRPQAWSAASAVAMVAIGLGIEPDVPRGRLTLRPLRPNPFGAFSVTGLRVGNDTVSVQVDPAGNIVHVEAPPSLVVDVLTE